MAIQSQSRSESQFLILFPRSSTHQYTRTHPDPLPASMPPCLHASMPPSMPPTSQPVAICKPPNRTCRGTLHAYT
ncbi:hypothetical protein BGZ61DRAFT_12310 [Ilyonectria robusta]|uniref:uncharacterized protein n=1 Tax=Ilyonectria robusta TaxID=1079257 RepID=UPI001E8D8243|nr:uncharacterized protein BGZ61DRAFT_12310 [Ilyonectria robusta]KAH8737271.1 hypothetical protein BGZ61DRAFT_12310 [Ilyonectria robusta]